MKIGSLEITTRQASATDDKGSGSGSNFEHQLLGWSALALALGLATNALFSGNQPDGTRLLYFSGATAALGASIAVGILGGFLFGMPKTLQVDALGDKEVRYIANTNLEQISDWLTKILVGIGLIQLTKLPAKLSVFSERVGPVFGESGASGRYGLAACLYGTILGFIISYLWTRARLKAVLEAADMKHQIDEVLRSREEANSKAWSLATRQLDGQTSVDPVELTKTLGAASPEWLALIYRRAEEQRAQHWQLDKVKMELTRPVFQALVALDKAKKFHRHFGSLGFVLKDQSVPDYAAAIDNLTQAIQIRGPNPSVSGWPLYEWSRAVCRILHDPNGSSQPPMRDAIRADVDAAKAKLSPRFFTQNHDPQINAIAQWMANNP